MNKIFNKLFRLNKAQKEITFKSDWKQVTLKDYFKIIDFITNEDLDDVEKTDLIILVLTTIKPNELSQLSITDYSRLKKSIEFVYTLPKSDLISEKLIIKDRAFDCDIKLDKVTAGQYLMLQNIQKIENYQERIKKCLGVFIRPQGVKWGDFDYDENVEFLFNNISIIDAISLSAFFLDTQKRLLKRFQLYMKKEKKMEMKKFKKNNQ